MPLNSKALLAKWGHVEGQGLGKDGEGIAEPIEAAGTEHRAGIGYADLKPVKSTARFMADEKFPERITESKAVYLSGLPLRATPGFIYKQLFDHTTPQELMKVQDIFLVSRSAYILFKTTEDAAEAVLDWDGQMALGHEYTRCHAMLFDENLLPNPDNEEVSSLSKYLEEKTSAIKSSTVEFSGLNITHTRRNLNKMLEVDLEQDWQRELEGEPKTIQGIEINAPGHALIRFINPSAAATAVCDWDCHIWADYYIEAKFVPDEYIQELEEKNSARTLQAKESCKLFVSNAGGLTVDQVRKAFGKITLNDVQFPPKGNFCFVFLATTDAVQILQQYPNGIRVEGRKIYPKMDKKSKAKGKFDLPLAPTPSDARADTPGEQLAADAAKLTLSPNPGPTLRDTVELKVANLHYSATQQEVRNLFSGLEIKRVKLMTGFAFVDVEIDNKLGSEEQRKLTALKAGKNLKVQGRSVTIKDAPRRR